MIRHSIEVIGFWLMVLFWVCVCLPVLVVGALGVVFIEWVEDRCHTRIVLI